MESEIRLLISRGDHFAAWAKMRDAISEEPSLQLCHSLAKLADGLDRSQAELRTVKIALLGSFTLEPLAPVLKACALGSRVLPEIYVGGFNAWRQEILDEESGLRRFQPEITILALRIEELAPDLAYRFTHLEPAEVRAQIDGTVCDCEKFLHALREWSSSKILAHSLPSPVFPDLGILDYQCGEGQHSAFRDLNDAWNAAVRGVGDAWVVDCGRLIQEVGWNQWHDPRMWASARMPLAGSAVRRLAEEYVKYLSAFLGSSKKVLVVDLDNTLWGGILGEDGFDGIQLGSEYSGSAYVEVQRAILTLQARGVVLAINSKNNPSDAWEVIEKHPGMILRPDHF
ncbi:MAG: HAD-IIIC family phosphatase, partial [Candidatus Binatia bacterium]